MREYENTTLQKPQGAEVEATQSQSAVAEPDVHRQDPLQDQTSPSQSTQQLSGGSPAHIQSILRQ